MFSDPPASRHRDRMRLSDLLPFRLRPAGLDPGFDGGFREIATIGESSFDDEGDAREEIDLLPTG